MFKENALEAPAAAEPERALTLKEYMEMQTAIILSPENVAAARAALGHEPSRNELSEYYIASGQAQEFENKYRRRLKRAA